MLARCLARYFLQIKRNKLLVLIALLSGGCIVHVLHKTDDCHKYDSDRRHGYKQGYRRGSVTYDLVQLEQAFPEEIGYVQFAVNIPQFLIGQHSVELDDNELVPRLVHVIWIYDKPHPFRFHQVICLLSVQKYYKPDAIIMWYSSTTPIGAWWEFVRLRITNIDLVQIDAPETIYGQPIRDATHQSDVMRIELLIHLGGLYLDLDVVLLKPLDELMGFNITQGSETPDRLGSGFILAAPNTTFLRIWHGQYRTFNDNDWNGHSVIIPMRLAMQFKQFINIDWYHIQHPNWEERHWLYDSGKLWDWKSNYAIHMWQLSQSKYDYHPDSIRSINSTLGEVFRYIYYGSPNILVPVADFDQNSSKEDGYLI